MNCEMNCYRLNKIFLICPQQAMIFSDNIPSNHQLLPCYKPHHYIIPGLYSLLGGSGSFIPGCPSISPVRGLTGRIVPAGNNIITV